MSRLETSIQDLDGDGFPEYLHSEDEDELRVSLSTTGRTNLLKSVNRPLGSTIVLSYVRNGNTYDQPQNRWVMNRIEMFDGHTGDGEDFSVTEYDCRGGMYDCEEQEFFGFAGVVERQMNNNGTGLDTIYRVVTKAFSNHSYYSKSLMLSSTTNDALGSRFLETASFYDLVDVTTGTTVADPQSLVATVFPQLTRSDSRFFEGQAVAGKATYPTFEYDALGNVTHFFDMANLNTTADDVESNIGYHSDLSAYVVGKAIHVTVIGNGAIMRERQASFAPGTGNLIQLNVLLAGGGAATSDMVYDGFGDLTPMTGPANSTSQRCQLNYACDTAVNTYVESISDSFGYVSAATYDVRYGELLSTLDLNARSMIYTLDDVGRITSVQGPYQVGTSFDTITFAYNPVRDVPGDTQYPDVTTSWALTDHIDTYRDISDPIQTALFIDGLGRAIQTKKDAAIYENGNRMDRMVASGRAVFDHVGRQIEHFYPTEEPLGQPGVFNTTFEAITPTLTNYDILDRPTDVTIPDGSATLMAYDFGADRYGTTQFRTLFTDAEGKQRETFADVRKLLTSVKEINPAGGQPTIWMSYTYDPLRQITEVRDDQDNLTTAAYDNFGRMTLLDSPDMGATNFTFDLASNLIAKQTANLTASGGQIDYTYDFQRLMGVSYPDYPGNNVAYAYGAPGEAGNRANRIMTVTSQGGSEDRFYGPLGELTKVVKTIASDTQGNGPNSPEVYTSEFTYDTWNRLQSMVYPDGEVLTNAHDSGGKLQQIDATKAGYDYAYLRDLGYDKFGQRTYLLAGNNTETTYAYTPETRRLNGLQAGNSQGRTFQDLDYSYDLVGNITAQANSAAVAASSQLGGATSFTCAYDDLYRLTGATGLWETAPD